MILKCFVILSCLEIENSLTHCCLFSVSSCKTLLADQSLPCAKCQALNIHLVHLFLCCGNAPQNDNKGSKLLHKLTPRSKNSLHPPSSVLIIPTAEIIKRAKLPQNRSFHQQVHSRLPPPQGSSKKRITSEPTNTTVYSSTLESGLLVRIERENGGGKRNSQFCGRARKHMHIGEEKERAP